MKKITKISHLCQINISGIKKVASTPFQDKIKSSLNQSFENSDMMVDSLNSIICQAADISIKKVRYTDKNIKSKQNKKQ